MLLNRCGTQTGSANLSVAMTDSADPVTTGTEFTYTINVTNHGPDVATGVVVNGALPAPSVAFAGMVSGTCTFVGDDAMTCPVGTIPVNGTASIVFRVRAVQQHRDERGHGDRKSGRPGLLGQHRVADDGDHANLQSLW